MFEASQNFEEEGFNKNFILRKPLAFTEGADIFLLCSTNVSTRAFASFNKQSGITILKRQEGGV